MVKAMNESGADFLYSDEVKYSGDICKISDPLAFNLKPGFGKDDLRSHNYICHFTVFSKKLLETQDQFYRKEYDGSQDHDMVLRLTERAEKLFMYLKYCIIGECIIIQLRKIWILNHMQ